MWRRLGTAGTIRESGMLEGSADFVGERVSGSHINADVYEYGFIAQAYYNSKIDKTAALREIIEVADATAFLAASGYQGSP